MKKLLSIIFVSLLLSGCATGPDSTSQTYLKDTSLIKVGMTYGDFKEIMIPYGTNVNMFVWSKILNDKTGDNNYFVICIANDWAAEECTGAKAKSSNLPGYVFKGKLTSKINLSPYAPSKKFFEDFKLEIIENSFISGERYIANIIPEFNIAFKKYSKTIWTYRPKPINIYDFPTKQEQEQKKITDAKLKKENTDKIFKTLEAKFKEKCTSFDVTSKKYKKCIYDADKEEKKTIAKVEKEAQKPIVASSGTAFFIDNNGHMITNHHVIEGCKDKSQISYNNENIKAKLIAKDEFLDLALLKADVKNSNFINISSAPPKKLKRIIVAGYPFGLELSNDLKFNSGIITSLKGLGDDSTRIQIDAAINPGNSGGPIVYEENGELAAVAVAGLSKDKTEAVNFGIKASSVENFLQSNQIDLTLVQQKLNFSNDDLAELLESSTLYTFCK
tara:strand:+ start:82 stop:1416 length:1335 start_codon:yes stop_codon:yes gene_type:complete